VIVSIPGTVRTTSSYALAVLAAALCLASFSSAQTAPANPPADPSQPVSSSQATLSPSAHPDATSVEIPTAAQIEAAAASPEIPSKPDPSAGSPAPKPSTATATKTGGPAPASTLPPKYNVDLIGQRGIGNGLDFYSLEREQALGRQLAAQVESSARLVTDPVITEYINRIGQNLVRNSDARVPFTIKVLDTQEVNAFALPGGFFYVNSGLILAADNEAELAGVMAHEIAHVCARHATKNMTRAQIWNVASIPLIFIGGPVAYVIADVAGLAVPLGFLKFSRDAEREADLLGLEYDYATGYDPQAFVEFFEKLNVEKKKQNLVAKAFSTHPMNVERIEAAQDEIRKYLPDRPEYILDTSEFESVKARLLAWDNGRRLHGAKPDSSRPVLLKRTSSSSDSASGSSTQDSSGASDQKDDGRPTLKRAPSSSSD
jgi:predicted Zn-dependent protease